MVNKIKRIIVPTLVLLLIASQLTGCASATQKEMIEMLNNKQAISIDVSLPENSVQGTEANVTWTELALLNNYLDFRLALDDTMQIVPFGTNGKNGVVYVDAVGKQTNNSTLQYAFMNRKFISQVWENETFKRVISAETKKLYTDVTSDSVALLAGINAYYNLISDAEPGYANMYRTLNRLEAMSALVKATTPVQEIDAKEFNNCTGVDEEVSTLASLVKDNVYLKTENNSLDVNTATGTMTRVEFLYMLVNTLYKEDYNTIVNQEKVADVGFIDAKNGDNLAEKIKFITEENPNPERLESYLLSYCIKEGKDKLPKELYSALVVARNKGILTTSETRWDEGITKGEALNFITKAFKVNGTSFSVDRGESTGEAISGTNNNHEENKEPVNNNESNTEEIIDNTEAETEVDSTEENKEMTEEEIKQSLLEQWSGGSNTTEEADENTNRE